MARTGRKQRAGKRTESGRLSRAGIAPLFDKGTEHAQAMRALYGQDGADAIGRAYRAGLLGEGQEAKALLDLARSISNAYWQAYSTGSYTCPLGDRTFGNVAQIDHERVKRREIWLSGVLDFVRAMGHPVRRAFDQLVIDVHPDNGPIWLDAILWANKRGHEADAKAMSSLRAALDALEQLA